MSVPAALLAAVLALPGPPASVPAGADVAAIARDLDAWLGRLDLDKALPERRATWLDERIAELEALLDEEPGRLAAVGTELLDLAGFRLTRLPDTSFFVGGHATADVRMRGLRALRRLAAGPRRDALFDWMTRGVLAERRAHPAERRWMALYLLADERTPLVDLALLGVAGDRSDPLRPDVLLELPGRASPAVDRFLVQNLDEARDARFDPHPFNLLKTRLGRGPLDPEAAGALGRRCKAMMTSDDWREASRGFELARALDPLRTAPMLIEALYAWQGRAERGTGSRRLVHEIVSELQRLSGRSIGPNPKNWTTWWRAVSEGKIPLHDDAGAEDESRTTTTFFGLQPVSDRVTFVIDHSGSMQGSWRAQGHSRYVEAIEQLVRYLQASGEDTRFNIVLFDSAPLRSTPGLVPATPENLERARKSLVDRPPEGGTNLRSAVMLALNVGGDGRVDLEDLHVDTIVVLCDGQTDSGPGWIRPLLETVHAEARVVFHCALIGTRSDGSLERLAQMTGGEFVRIAR